MDMIRVHAAFAELNKVLAEEGSTYGVSGLFASDTLYRTQVIHLDTATEDEMTSVQKTYVSQSTSYRRDRDGKLQPIEEKEKEDA